jgi:hypothetical protein
MLTYADSMNALMQARLKELFVDVVEAFVFLDQNGDESISTVELAHGFKRMGIVCDMKKLGSAVAADGMVDMIEFMRLFAWQDVPNIEQALRKTRFRYREIQEAAALKRKGLPDITPQDLAAKKDTNNTPRECGPSRVDAGSIAVDAGSHEAPPDIDGVRVMPLLPGSLASLPGAAAPAEGAEQDAGEAAAAGEHPQALRSEGDHPQSLRSEGDHPQALRSEGEHPQALRSEGEHPQALRSGRIRSGREVGPDEESDADAGYRDVRDVRDVDDQRVLAARDLAGEDDESASEARVAAGLASALPAGTSSAGTALAC